MKSRSTKIAALGTLVLPLLMFAGQQPAGSVNNPNSPAATDSSESTRTVQVGKGGGITRNEPETKKGNAYRSQTAADAGVVQQRSTPHDSAFTK
jgi:hypothetical protein